MSPVEKEGSLLSLLPPDIQAQFRTIGLSARDLWGTPRNPQAIVSENLDFFENLLRSGVTYGALAMLLAELDLTQKNGAPWTRGTLASAICRARVAAGATGGRMRTAAASGIALQRAAALRAELPPAAATGQTSPACGHSKNAANDMPAPEAPAKRAVIDEPHVSGDETPAQPTRAASAFAGDDQTMAHDNRRAADRLAKLRSSK